MLVKRLLVTILLIPVGVGLIALGGPAFTLAITIVLGLAAWEYVRLFQMAGYTPAAVLVIGGTALLTLSRGDIGFFEEALWLSLLIMLAMTWHLVDYERGRNQAATDFAVTLGGILYLGWLGSYLVLLRYLPDGKWWFLLVLPAVWIADSGAFWIGSRWGRRKLSPRLSPRKTWEGYAAGVVTGALGGALLAAVWGLAAPSITLWAGAGIGLVLALLTPLGDLGESMIKRQAGAKDSSTIIPGHGGVMDRIDSWIWAGVIGYYLVALLLNR